MRCRLLFLWFGGNRVITQLTATSVWCHLFLEASRRKEVDNNVSEYTIRCPSSSARRRNFRSRTSERIYHRFRHIPHRFPASANFESKFSVRALMWSANSGTPRSSCICLLLTYQGAPVARRRHLDCNTCNLPTWVRAADLHAGHA